MSIDYIEEIDKFNPNHDRLGRFTSATSASSFTIRTRAGYNQGMADRSIQRAKDQQAASTPKTSGHIDEKMSKKDAVKHTMKTCGVDEKTAEKYVTEVKDYTYGMATDMRKYQSGKLMPWDDLTDDEAKSMSDAVENFISKSPKWGNSGELYRWISVDQSTANGIIDSAKNGKTLNMMGTSSWTSSKKVIDDYMEADDVEIIFKTSGTKKGTSIKHLSAFPEQDEVIISKDAKWKGKSVQKDKNGRYVVELEELQ